VQLLILVPAALIAKPYNCTMLIELNGCVHDSPQDRTTMKMAIALMIISLSASCLAQSAGKADVFSASQLHDKFAELAPKTKVSGSSGATLGDYGSHAIKLSERTISGGAEVHSHFDDIMMVVEGKATLITGGELINAHTETGGEATGSGIRNGTTQVISAGDVVHVPAGTPHQIVIAPGTTYQALVIKIKE
jgi:mannose-6-phosphate isomerase-like protein (cupin superfamily)